MSHHFKRLVVTVGAVLFLVSAVGSATAQTVNLRMANWVPPVHHMVASLNAWIAEVDRASGGTLKIQLLPPGLAKPPGQYDLAKNGVVDISWGVPGYTRGRFPLVRVMELPFMMPNAEVGSLSLWQWYAKHGLADKEFSDTRLLMLFVHGPGVLHTKDRVATLNDLKGMKLRVGGGGVALSQKLGAVPVAMSATKSHESLQKGTTTGTLFPFESIKGFRLGKLVKYHLEFPGGIYTTPFFLTMNKKSWDQLSAKHKAVLNRVGGAWGSQYLGRFWDAADAAGRKIAIDNGNTISTLGPAELKRWGTKIQFMTTEWIAKANKGGFNGKGLLSDLKRIIRKNSK